jgi:hypothetical protein
LKFEACLVVSFIILREIISITEGIIQSKDVKTQLEEAKIKLAEIKAETARVKEANDKKQEELCKMKLNIFVEENKNKRK